MSCRGLKPVVMRRVQPLQSRKLVLPRDRSLRELSKHTRQAVLDALLRQFRIELTLTPWSGMPGRKRQWQLGYLSTDVPAVQMLRHGRADVFENQLLDSVGMSQGRRQRHRAAGGMAEQREMIQVECIGKRSKSRPGGIEQSARAVCISNGPARQMVTVGPTRASSGRREMPPPKSTQSANSVRTPARGPRG